MTIVVVGGTGMLGRPLVKALLQRGSHVRVVARNAAAIQAAFGDRVESLCGDVRDADVAARAVAGASAVHLNLRASTPDEFDTLEVAGVASIAAAAATAGVERLGYLSAAGFEAGDPTLLPVRAKQASEALVRASGVPFTIFRATHFMESLDLYVRGNSASIIGKQPHAYRYLAGVDYGEMVANAYATPAAANEALTLLGPEAMTMRGALERYIALLRPDVKLIIASLTQMKQLALGNPALRQPVILFDAFRRLPETEESTIADALLGPAITTLDAWCATRRAALQRIDTTTSSV